MGTEIDKLNKIKDKSQSIGLFLDWLLADGLLLCRRHEHNEGCRDGSGELWCGYHEGEAVPVTYNIQELLAGYFDIDLKKVEEEKMEILENLKRDHKEVNK